MSKTSFPFAAVLTLVASTASATNFAVTSGTNSTAQTLGTAAGQTGSVSAGATLAVGGTAVAVTISGSNATVTNLGTMNQTGTGRVIRDNTGVTGLVVTNGSLTNSAALMQAADADVFQMNKSPASVTLNNYGQMVSLNASKGGSQAVDFTAILGGANIINNFAGGLMRASEADAVRPGVNGVVYNAGSIVSTTTTGSSSDGIDAQNDSGVAITNDLTGLIDGARHGVTGGALDAITPFTTSVTNNASGVIRGNNGSGINLDGFNALQNATVVNRGTITGNGVTGDGDGIDSDGLITLTNTGVIRSLNAVSLTAGSPAQSEGISVGGGTIINSGKIEGLVAAGNTNAVGRGISLLGNDITTGPLAGTREAIYGNATITNQAGGLIRGDSDSGIAVDGPASGFTVTINNNAGAQITGGGTANAAIRTGADNDTITNAGVLNGASGGKAVDMGAGNNALIITGGAATIIGDVNGGTGGTNTMTMNLGAGNTFGYAGAASNFNVVEFKSGTTTLSGVSTYTGLTKLSGGNLTLNGSNRLAAASDLLLGGGTLQLQNAAGANAQTFASLALNAASSIDLGGSSLTFNALGSISGGTALTLFNYVAANSPGYAFRILGDATGSADFQTLVGETTINGLAVAYRFDGTYTDVAPVPLPGALVLMLSGLGIVGAARRRPRNQAVSSTR